MDHCQNRFSPEEIAVMRATLLTEKASWLTPAMLEKPIDEQPVAIEPVQDQLVPNVGAFFRWNAAPNATHYLVQASRFASFSFKQLDVVTTDTFLTAGLLSANLKYYWRIQPFNDWHACAPFSESETFMTAPISAASEPDADGWRCYPSLLSMELRSHSKYPMPGAVKMPNSVYSTPQAVWFGNRIWGCMLPVWYWKCLRTIGPLGCIGLS
ncbi:MAG: hypothetical protein IPH31_23185 [Lewinellaceae bacterium]|nr:hypothetical protein [Lewinellaceae bacterium]